MLLLTTLLLSATVLANLPPGTPCGTILSCSTRFLDGEYISTAANGFVCKPAEPDSVVYVFGFCNDTIGFTENEKTTKELCDKLNGVICPDNGVPECLVETPITKQADVEAEFKKCRGGSHSLSVDDRGCSV
jgi:hypothetical protein